MRGERYAIIPDPKTRPLRKRLSFEKQSSGKKNLFKIHNKGT